MTTLCKSLRSATLGLALMATLPATGALAGTDLTYTNLSLINGWQTFQRTPAIAIDGNNIVHLRGIMQQISGTSLVAFNVPPKFRPSRRVSIPVDTNEATIGLLLILLDGTVSITSNNQADARQFTSLEGVSYVKN